jgi:hypothetical protein
MDINYIRKRKNECLWARYWTVIFDFAMISIKVQGITGQIICYTFPIKALPKQ